MSGWCPSSLVCGVWNGGGVLLLLVHLGVWCSPCFVHPGAALISTAVVSCYCSLPGVVVCGCVFLCGVRVVGYPPMTIPHSWWWVGPLWMVGWYGELGWHSD